MRDEKKCQSLTSIFTYRDQVLYCAVLAVYSEAELVGVES